MNVSRLWQLALLVACIAMNAAVHSADAADHEFSEMIKQRVQDWQPTKDERLLDQVGWASDLVEAQRLAKKHDRPLFVFTYSGSTTRANAIALQRC